MANAPAMQSRRESRWLDFVTDLLDYNGGEEQKHSIGLVGEQLHVTEHAAVLPSAIHRLDARGIDVGSGGLMA